MATDDAGVEYNDELEYKDELEFQEERARLIEREEKILPRKIKDNVFCDLFRSKRNQLLLYRALHPEDESATIKDVRSVTCRNVLAKDLYNDLGFYVRDSLIILVEAQSTWSSSIVVRLFLYLAATLRSRHIFQNKILPYIYGNRLVELPEAELYVIYTGKRRKGMPDTISWRRDVSHGRNSTWDFSVRVLYDGAPGDIINQYVAFCKKVDAQRRLTGYTRETVELVVEECLNQGILVDYLKKKEPETMLGLLTSASEQKMIFTGMLEDREKLGEKRGERKTRILFAQKALKRGSDSFEEIADFYGLTIAEVEALARGRLVEA